MNLRLGDMEVLGTPRPKLLKALAVLPESLHPTFDRQPHLKSFASRNSCVLVALTVRDFLNAIGFRTARVEPVVFVAWAAPVK